MKKLLLLLLLITSCYTFAQDNISYQRIVALRGTFTTAERDALDVPTGDLYIIFNTTTQKLEYALSDDVWAEVGAGATGLDNQNLTWTSPNLFIQNGNSVDLSSLLDNTDSQTASQVPIVDADGHYTATNVETALDELIDIIGAGSTDDQTAAEVNTTTTNFDNNLSSADDTVQKALETLDEIASGGTDDQTLSLVSDQLSIESGNSVNLAPYSQSLLLAGNTLSIENQNSVDLSGYLDDTDTNLTQEEVQDFIGSMVTGNTETLISVSYDDTNNEFDFTVTNDLSQYSNTTSNFSTGSHTVDTQLSAEQVEDLVGGMIAGGSDNLSYDDAGGTMTVVDGSGSGLNADLLDGLTGTSYLRSDVSDTMSGILTISGSTASTSKDNGALVVANGGVGIEGELHVGGDVEAFNTSDERLKRSIKPIKKPMKKIRQLGGYTYKWKGFVQALNGKHGKDVGVIAQEVENVVPEAVRNSTSGYLQVNYDKLVPLMIEALKEADLRITDLEYKLKQMKKALK